MSTRGTAPDTRSRLLLRHARNLVPVLWLASLAALGVRGMAADDARYAWGMFPYVLRYTVEYRWRLDDGTTLPYVPPKRAIRRAKRVLTPGKELEHWYGLGAVRTELTAYGRTVWRKGAPPGAQAFEIVLKWRKHDVAVDDAVTEVIVVTREQ